MSTPNPATTPWVPLWDLNGGVNINYRGSYVAATQYADGDVVIYNGYAYMCCRPTTNAPVLWPQQPGVLGYGTSLPASPYDGQEFVLVDSLTNPSYQWRFRYNAGSSSAYKWEYIGGTAAHAYIGPQETTTSARYVDLATVGPGITLPRAGDYSISWGVCVGVTNVSVIGIAAIKFGSANAVDSDGISLYNNNAGVLEVDFNRTNVYAGLAAQAIRLQYGVWQPGNSIGFQRRWLSATPRRVA